MPRLTACTMRDQHRHVPAPLPRVRRPEAEVAAEQRADQRLVERAPRLDRAAVARRPARRRTLPALRGTPDRRRPASATAACRSASRPAAARCRACSNSAIRSSAYDQSNLPARRLEHVPRERVAQVRDAQLFAWRGWRSSRQKRSCWVQLNWSTFRCGRNEHSMPAPQTNCVNGSDRRRTSDERSAARAAGRASATRPGMPTNRPTANSCAYHLPFKRRGLDQHCLCGCRQGRPIERCDRRERTLMVCVSVPNMRGFGSPLRCWRTRRRALAGAELLETAVDVARPVRRRGGGASSRFAVVGLFHDRRRIRASRSGAATRLCTVPGLSS